MNPWAIVAIAGLMETGWALGLKYSEGFTRPVPTVLTVLGALASFGLLSEAMKSLPVEAGCCAMMHSRSSDRPAPISPAIPTISPLRTVKDTSRIIWRSF